MADRTFTPQLPGSRLCECGVLAEHHGEGMRCPAASSFPRPPRDEAEREACEFWTDKREMGPAHSCLVRSPHSNNCCTRRVGHEGDHVDSTTRDVIEARWPATPAEPSPLTERLAEALRRLHAVAHPESKDALRCLYAALLAEYDASRAVPPVTTEAREPAPTPSTQGATWRREPPTVEEVRGCPEWKFQRESGGTVEIELRVSEEFGVIDDDGDAVASHKFYRRGEWSPCLPPGTAPTPPAVDPRLVEAARTDVTINAALKCHEVLGASLVEALTAAVLDLARWRKERISEVTRAVMMQPPPAIVMAAPAPSTQGATPLSLHTAANFVTRAWADLTSQEMYGESIASAVDPEHLEAFDEMIGALREAAKRTAPTPPDEVRDAAQRLLAYMDGRAVSHCNVHPQCTDQDNPLRRENWCPWCTAVGDLRDALAAVRAPRRGR